MAETARETLVRLRLAELLTALSIVTDLGIGRVPQSAVQACCLATRLAQRMGLGAADIADIYYATLLRYIGCTAYAHEEAMAAAGDEIDARAETTRMDLLNPRELLAFHLFRVGRRSPPLERAAAVALGLPRTLFGARELVASHCEVGASMARRLDMTPAVQQALEQIFERWDGKGWPNKLAGDALCLPIRFAHLATQAIAFTTVEGVEVAVEIIRQRSGGMLDPSIAAAYLEHGPSIHQELNADDVWMAAVEAEPEPHRGISEPEFDGVARAFADMADLKLFFTRGHSSGVAALAEGAATILGLGAAETSDLRRAALFHDIGRVGISNGVWEKEGSLTFAEWEQVRLHPYHTDRILSRASALAPLAPTASMHHERQDGSGYFRQVSGAAIPMPARILAAADAYQAMTEPRPHRPALTPEQAAEQLRSEAKTGKLDHEAVRGVLEAAGHRTTARKQPLPAGLTDREVQVLRLIATGASYRDVARELVISPRTAAHHVQHIYNKIGVSTRAAAAMFAMEHDLLRQ